MLVLVPGFIGGAGDFRLIGREIVSRVPDLQVWALDRRSNLLEDTSVFAGGDPDKAFDYYLRFQPVDGRRFQPVNGQDLPFTRQWGLDLALRDLRRVILTARAEGARKVILGGHSLGASTAVAYSTWDFTGRRGFEDVDGLVLIDGGLKGTFTSPTFEEVTAALPGAPDQRPVRGPPGHRPALGGRRLRGDRGALCAEEAQRAVGASAVPADPA